MAPRRMSKAGHRSWAPGGQRVRGVHRGDIMSAEKRSKLMARIHGKDTEPERLIANALIAEGIAFEQHNPDLPGRPDFVFQAARLAVFVDGDFWHGWRFPLWKHKLAPAWQAKIAATRDRDKRNFRRLRRSGWTVIRIWEHQVERDVTDCVCRILARNGKLTKIRGGSGKAKTIGLPTR